MFIETIGLSPSFGEARPFADSLDSKGRGRNHVEFSFPLPKGDFSSATPPRAILSLRDAGSMRYLKKEANPRRGLFFASQGIKLGHVVATELHHTRRLRLVETSDLGILEGCDREIDASGLRGVDEGDGGPDGAEGRDGIVFLPSLPEARGSSGPSVASPDRELGSKPHLAATYPVAATFPVATVTVADCMPIWLWDAASGAWGLLHSGWKGTGILAYAVNALVARRVTSPASMSVILGPAIGVCCYEVPEERAAAFEGEFGPDSVDRSGPRPRLDIRAANLAIARRIGIGAVLSVDACTFCDPALGSFRREGPEVFTRMVAACFPR